MALREIFAFFGVEFDKKPLEEGNALVDRAVGNLQRMGAAVVGAFLIEKVREFTVGLIQQADALGDQAQTLRISAQALQEWQYAGKFANIEAGALEAAIGRITKDTATGQGGKLFKELGVQTKDTNGHLKDASQLFEDTGLALAKMPDKTKAAARAMQLFGQGNGQKILDLFKEGAPGLAKMRAEFAALGGGFDEDFVKRSSEIDDNFKRLNVAFTSAKVTVVGLLLPAINLVTQTVTKASAALKDFLDTSSAGQTILAGAGIAAGIAAWHALGNALQFAKENWKLLAAAVIAEDIWTFLRGGRSITGDIISFFFGPDAPGKVRGWLNETLNAFQQFFGDLNKNPVEFSETWDRALDSIAADIGDVFLNAENTIKSHMTAAAKALGFTLSGAWTDVKYAVLESIASWDDAVTTFVNGFLDKLGPIGDAFRAIGLGGEGPGHAVADLEAMRRAEKQKQLNDYDAAKTEYATKPQLAGPPTAQALAFDRLAGSFGPAPVSVQTNAPITIQMFGADATPANVGRAVGTAVGGAVRTAGAALVQGARK